MKQEKLGIDSKFLENYEIPIKIKIDDDSNKSPGRKFNEWEMKGVPLRITVGKRDLENGQVEVYRRDTQEKQFVNIEDIATFVMKELSAIQKNIFKKHEDFTVSNTFEVETYDELKEKVEKGFVLAHWDGTNETAMAIQDELKATIRCLPFDFPIEEGVDPYS